MTDAQLMNIFQIAFYICIAITVFGFGSAIIMFFKFDIPTVFALMTGRIQAKTVEKMMQSGDYYLGKGEEQSYSESYTGGTSGDLGTERIGPADDTAGRTADVGGSSFNQDATATTVLGSAQETTVLGDNTETSVLGGAADTTVLSGFMDTTVLSGQQFRQPVLDAVGAQDNQPYYESTEQFGNGYVDDAGATVMLQATDIPQITFKCIEHTMLIHTDEVIG